MLSVVVPTHNRRDSLMRLLHVLRADASVDEIVVVDDGSEPPVVIEDQDIVILRKNRPRLVSAARNEGALKSAGDIVLFIDDDCVPQKGAIGWLRHALETNHKIGLAGPVLVYGSDTETVWCAGVTHDKWTGRTRLRARGQSIQAIGSIPSGCEDFPSAFAVRRDCFEAVGGFDSESFPIMLEEADLAARIRERGYSVELVREAVVIHDIKADAGLARLLHMTSPRFAYLLARGRGRFIRRHSSPVLRIPRMVFWLGVLVPIYLVAAISDRDRGGDEKLQIVRSLLRGAFEGAFAKWA